jgi:hypothetical protein
MLTQSRDRSKKSIYGDKVRLWYDPRRDAMPPSSLTRRHHLLRKSAGRARRLSIYKHQKHYSIYFSARRRATALKKNKSTISTILIFYSLYVIPCLSVESAIGGGEKIIPLAENASWPMHCNTCSRTFRIHMTDEYVLTFEKKTKKRRGECRNQE